MRCKPGEVTLQGRKGITKWANFYYKVGQTLSQSGVGITKWDIYYKIGQYLYHIFLKNVSGLILNKFTLKFRVSVSLGCKDN